MARPPSEHARLALLASAQEVIEADGVSALTVDEVVRRSGVAKTTLYRQFGDLDGLVFALMRESVSISTAPNTGSLRGDLDIILRGYLKTFDDPLKRELFLWMNMKAMLDAEAAGLYARARIQPEGPTMVALRAAVTRGEIPKQMDLVLAMHFIQGGFFSRRVIGNKQMTKREVDALIDMIVNGLSRTV